MPSFDLTSLRGGLDDTTPPSALAPDACTVAENVEFVNSTLGERRLGCTAITLPASITGDANLDAVTWMFRHLPDNDETTAELWAFAQSLSAGNNILTRRQVSAWSTVTQTDAITSTFGRGHRISAQSLHGKLFLAHKSAVDRLHVWDGTSLRRASLAAPAAAPSVANTGAGTFSGTRYYRVRYAVLSGSTVVLRSEPSAVTTFAPSGAGSAARVTKPATISEGETHWEVEASLDNSNFYRIARVVVGTTFYDDSTAFGTGYATSGNALSADIGDYTVIPSAKFLSADEDRLICAGSWEVSAEASRVRWTPVFAAEGNGNDERLELDTDPFLDLDGYEGGEITGLSRAVNGYLFAFKRTHIYKLVRTGKREQAYEAIAITKAKGALPGSLVEAVDQAGNPSQYFLDPSSGPMRIGSQGLQWCGRDIQTFWRRVNVNATIPCHGVYYSAKRQVHFWVAVDGSNYPNAKIVVHTNEMRDTEEGARRGWVTVAKDDRIATAHCSTLFASNVDTTDARSFALVPFIGKEKWTVGVNTIRDYVQRCDTGTTDAHTTGDTESTYYGKVKTKPFILAGLLNQHSVRAGALLGKANSSPSGLVYVKAVRDFGIEDKTVSTMLLASGSEEHVIRLLDNLTFSELYALQVELGDLDTNATPSGSWELNQLQLKISGGQTA